MSHDWVHVIGSVLGPTDPKAIEVLLRPHVIEETVDVFGEDWLFAVSDYWPERLYADPDLCFDLAQWDRAMQAQRAMQTQTCDPLSGNPLSQPVAAIATARFKLTAIPHT